MFALLGCMCGVYMTIIIIYEMFFFIVFQFFSITSNTEIEFIKKYSSQLCRYFLFIALHLNNLMLMAYSLLLPLLSVLST